MKTKTRRKLKTVYIGIDLHSATTVIALTDERGRLLAINRFPTTGRHLIDHIVAIRAARKFIAVEETPMTHWALELLRPLCTKVISCDPKHNRWISRNARKCDEEDAERLARLLRLGELSEVFHTRNADRFAFKAAVQHYLDVQRDRVRAKNKIKALLRRVGLTQVSGEMVYSKKGRKVIFDVVPSGSWTLSLARRYRHYDWIHTEAREALREVRQLGKPYREIAEFEKVPGVGPVSAHTVSAFLQTPHRFAGKGQLCRYAALSITDRSSDNKPIGYQRLEKSGSTELKSATFNAWRGAITARRDNEVKDYYQAILATNGYQQKRARLTTQRKILCTLWALWRRGETYDPALFIHCNARS